MQIVDANHRYVKIIEMCFTEYFLFSYIHAFSCAGNSVI